MVGRSLDEKFPKQSFKLGKEGFQVENLVVAGTNEPINFSVRYGEIVGISGLVGAGRTELARAIFGVDHHKGGKVFIDGKEIRIKSPRDAINAGIAFITEDRKSEGLLLDMTLDFNMAIANMDKFKGNTGLLDLKAMRREAVNYVKELKIRPGNIELHSELEWRKSAKGCYRQVVMYPGKGIYF